MAKRKQEQSVDFKGVEADVQEPAVKKSKLDPQIVVRKAVLENKDTMCLIGSFLEMKDCVRLGNTNKPAKNILLNKEKMQKLKASRTCDKCCKYIKEPAPQPLCYFPKKSKQHFKAGRYCSDCRPHTCRTCKHIYHLCEMYLMPDFDGGEYLLCEDCFDESGAYLVCDRCGFPPDNEAELDEDGVCPTCVEYSNESSPDE